ncbi:unnamed protein product [Caenorhabditis angaria]|uniref:Serpentine Receptor, class H n=1 Tax=Caenorhabditis angaria TaxID=860376 RepID=A0A9P1NA30_9PELO|nr:unnamed protein product [Caenorhabditis angaria]
MSSSLQQYFNEQFAKCSAESILARENFMSWTAHALTLIAFPLNFLSLFCIIFKTPEKMRSMRNSMLYFQSICAFNDILFSIFMCPFIFYPYCAGFTIGLLNDLNVPVSVQFCFGAGVVTSTGLAIPIVLESQHHTLVKNYRLSDFSRKIFIGINISMAYILLFPMVLIAPDQDWGRLEMLKKLPCPAIEFFQHDIFVLAIDNTAMAAFMTVACLFAISSAVFFTSHSIFELTKKRVDISTATRKLQQKYFIKVFIQIATPVFIMIFPLIYLITAMRNNYYNQAANNLCVLIILFHGVSATTITIFTYKPYRRSVLRLISCGYYRPDDQRKLFKVSLKLEKLQI